MNDINDTINSSMYIVKNVLSMYFLFESDIKNTEVLYLPMKYFYIYNFTILQTEKVSGISIDTGCGRSADVKFGGAESRVRSCGDLCVHLSNICSFGVKVPCE